MKKSHLAPPPPPGPGPRERKYEDPTARLAFALIQLMIIGIGMYGIVKVTMQLTMPA